MGDLPPEARFQILIHEFGHLFHADLAEVAKTNPKLQKSLDKATKWLEKQAELRMIEKGQSYFSKRPIHSHDLTLEANEVMADTLITWVKTGQAPTPEMATILERFKEWLDTLWHELWTHNRQLPPEINNLYRDMFGDPNPTTYGRYQGRGTQSAWLEDKPGAILKTERPRSATDPEGLTGMGSGLAGAMGDNYRVGLRQSVETTGKLPDIEYNKGKPSLIAQVFERMVKDGAGRDTATLDDAMAIVERGKNAKGVQAEYNAWMRSGGVAPTPLLDAYQIGEDATWRVNDTDTPVKITGMLGVRDNVRYYSIEGSKTGVPESQLLKITPTNGAAMPPPPRQWRDAPDLVQSHPPYPQQPYLVRRLLCQGQRPASANCGSNTMC